MFTPDLKQQEVLDIKHGKYAVLAPPGSGKTELLVQRLKQAIASGIPTQDIACLTFTNRAARSMNQRLGANSQNVFVGNFHAFAICFLKKVGVFGAQHVVVDEATADDMMDIAFERLRKSETPDDPEHALDSLLSKAEQNIDPKLVNYFGMVSTGGPSEQRPLGMTEKYLADLITRIKEVVRPFLSLLTAIKYNLSSRIVIQADHAIREKLNLQTSPSEIKRPLVWSVGILLGMLKLLNKHYDDIKDETFAFDYDDLLFKTLKWLNENPTHPLCQSLKWVQLDEAQDLNDIQWEIFDRIVHPDACVVVFADPQQAIYSFMGADYRTLMEHIDTDSMTRIPLTTNYRSPKLLLDFFALYAKKNLGLSSEWKVAIDGQTKAGVLSYSTHTTDFSERDYIASVLIPDILKTENGRVAILFRTNKSAILSSEALYFRGTPHFIVAKFDLFQLKVTKDFMAFLQTLQRPMSRLPWIRLFSLNNRASPLTGSLHFVNQCRGAGIHPHWVLTGAMTLNVYPPMQMLETAMKGRLVVLDTETTGTDPLTSDIIQFAAVEIVNGNIGRDFSVYLTTDKDIGESETIHHISKETLESLGLDRSEGFKQILDFIGDSAIAAHNLAFDLAMLENNIRTTLGMTFSDKHKGYCTLETAIILDPEAPKHKLEHLIQRYGLEGANTHDARDDVYATAHLILHFSNLIIEKTDIAFDYFQKHVKAFAKFHQDISPVWNKLHNDLTGEYSFDELFAVFLEIIPTDYYESQHVEDLRNKLLRHMKFYTKPAQLRTLLDTELHHYTLYREPDLILENDRIIVSTIHRAKGLEFETVIVPECHSSAFPSYFSKNDAFKEKEDARLLFVALTRAKSKLLVTIPEAFTTAKGSLIKVKCSPFLQDLLDRFPKTTAYCAPQPVNAPNASSAGGKTGWRNFKCPECGRTWPWDGSKQHDNRCFGCGWVPSRNSSDQQV